MARRKKPVEFPVTPLKEKLRICLCRCKGCMPLSPADSIYGVAVKKGHCGGDLCSRRQ
jgi:hypothetical protein